MKHKRWIVVALSVVLVGAVWIAAEAQTSGNRIGNLVVGRFQLMAGTNAVDEHAKPPRPEPGVFKIDTTTGRAWKLREHIDADGKRELSWQQIPHMNMPGDDAE